MTRSPEMTAHDEDKHTMKAKDAIDKNSYRESKRACAPLCYGLATQSSFFPRIYWLMYQMATATKMRAINQAM